MLKEKVFGVSLITKSTLRQLSTVMRSPLSDAHFLQALVLFSRAEHFILYFKLIP